MQNLRWITNFGYCVGRAGRVPLACLIAGAILGRPAPSLAAPDERESMDFFEAKIRPVLVEHCYKCHSVEGKKRKGELWLDSRAGILEGGKSGPVLVPAIPRRAASSKRFVTGIRTCRCLPTIHCQRPSCRISKLG